jgi:fumarate hydratase class II
MFIFFSNAYINEHLLTVFLDEQLAQGGTAVGTGLNTKKGYFL